MGTSERPAGSFNDRVGTTAWGKHRRWAAAVSLRKEADPDDGAVREREQAAWTRSPPT